MREQQQYEQYLQYQQHYQQYQQRQRQQQQQQYHNCSVADGDRSTASSSIESQEQELNTENGLVRQRINHLSVSLSCLIQQEQLQVQQQP